MAVFDVDAHDTVDVDAWWQTEIVKIDVLLKVHPDLYIYRTRGGYRIVGVLPRAYELRDAEEARHGWTPLYCAWVCYLRRCFDIAADPACKDWNRIYRLPHATRDGSNQPEERAIIGELVTGSIWKPKLTEDDHTAAQALVKSVKPRSQVQRKSTPKTAPTAGTSDYRGRGILFAAFENRNWIRKEIDSDKCAVVCPWESSHTADKGSESSTVLYFAKPGHEIGYLHCSHAHCAALASERAPRITAMIELAQSEPGIPVLPSDLDADPWKFCCTNGTIDLRTGALLPRCREDLITRFSAVQYDPKAESELWEIYLDSATNRDKELEAYIRRAVGYSLQGTVTERKFFFVFGPPGGTKSTFIETIGAAFGGYHQPADSETWLLQNNIGGNRGDLVRLAGARLVTSVEVRKEARFDEALIKRITGGDALTAAAKYENEVTFTPALTLWLAANDPPAIRDDDEGMWARVCRIPFTHALSADQQDCTMRERLRAPEVLSAVLAWAVRGCVDWQTSGLGTCRAVAASVAEYRESMDRAAGFLDDECVFAQGVRVLATKIRKAYEAWCSEKTIKPLSGNDLAKRLEARGCTSSKSNGYRYWLGVRLLDELFDSRPAGSAGSSGHAPTKKCSMSRPRGDFPVEPCPGDPGDPGDEAEHQAEFSWRGDQC